MRLRLVAAAGAVTLAVPMSAAAPPATAAAADPTCHGETATVVGTADDDELQGTKHRDVIVSLGGYDTIHALGGDDVICSGGKDDSVLAGAGDDTVSTGEGEDYLYGGAGRDVLRGGAPDYDRKGNLYPDTFLPGPGHDVVYGSKPKASDVVDYSVEHRPARVDLVGDRRSSDRLVRVDVIIGTRYDDRIRIDHGRALGLGGSDRLSGNGTLVDFIRKNESTQPYDPLSPEGPKGHDGHDTLRGLGKGVHGVLLRGHDRFIGGRGKDLVDAHTGGDRLTGGRGRDQVTIHRPDKHQLRGTVRLGEGYLPGKPRTRVRGFESYGLPMSHGTIVGTKRGEAIEDTTFGSPHAKAVRILGRGGKDRAYSYSGPVRGGPGDDRVFSTAGRAYGGPGNDRVRAIYRRALGGPGADTVFGYRQFGGKGDDRLQPRMREGQDITSRAQGGPGHDVTTIRVDYGTIFDLAGGPGRDLLVFRGGHEGWTRLDLARHRLVVLASDERWRSRVVGFESAQMRSRKDSVLNGDAKDNRLIGGAGDDTVDGRGGTDTCVGETVRNCEN